MQYIPFIAVTWGLLGVATVALTQHRQEHHLRRRVMTEADKAMIQALAAVVIQDRLKRAHDTGAPGHHGRVPCVFVGQPSEAELAWERIRAQPREEA